ncbi:MAG: hypothetical protein DRI36_02900 [Caldiserica bacterium]|nr:MAG: hypothetical protein DRI36_02900 [Caldisericota bacterium]
MIFLVLFTFSLFAQNNIMKFINEGKYSKALEIIEEKISPKNSVYWSLKGLIKLNQKMYNEAISYFEKAKKLNPEDENNYYMLGLLYENIGGREKDAIENFEKFLEISKNKKKRKIALKHLKRLKEK